MASNPTHNNGSPMTSRYFDDELSNHDGAIKLGDDPSPSSFDDDRNLQTELDAAALEDEFRKGSRTMLDSTAGSSLGTRKGGLAAGDGGRNRSRWQAQEEEEVDDVPGSLLVEGNRGGDLQYSRLRSTQKLGHPDPHRPSAVPDRAARRTHAHWDTPKTQTRPRAGERAVPEPVKQYHPAGAAGGTTSSARDRAAWRWVNVTNLDHFILDVYHYYQGCGIWCILTDRALHLVETTFVAVFVTFLTQCIDHSKISGSKTLHDLVVPQCASKISTAWSLGLWIFVLYIIWKMVQFAVDLPRLWHLREFFVHLLRIPEEDMQTVSWQDIVARIMALRDTHAETATNLPPSARRYLGSQSKKRLDAHDIANRLMRRDNYFIALINKDILNFSLRVPFIGDRAFFSRTLEWYMNFVIIDFVFNHSGQVNQEFLKAQRRGTLSAKLRQRFVFAGVLNLILAPFVLAYILVLYFFESFLEFKSDPSRIGARRYTPLALWKFREFNELAHLFHERVNMSYPFATRYLDQFPKQITERVARTVAFISGALAAVLTLVSLIDPEIFSVELTPDRTGLFYIGILGAVWAFARGRVSEDEIVFDPEYAMRNVIEYTHYMPDHWHGRLHGSGVMREFSELYKLKAMIFLEEVLGIITTPFLLLFALPGCSDQIIDFFREFTIHVDGLGYVCSFAVFDFKREGEQLGLATDNHDVREDYYSTKHGKMAASYYGFIDNYVMNPKTGIPGHMPPGPRPAFQPPPAFPPLNQHAPAAETLRSDPVENEEGGRFRSRAPGAHAQPWAARGGASMSMASPMASMLLDRYHHPAGMSYGGRSMHRARQARQGYGGGGAGAMEQSLAGRAGRYKDGDDDGAWEGELGGSVWETSPPALSRENTDDPDVGVLDLIYQFQQAHRDQPRKGGF